MVRAWNVLLDIVFSLDSVITAVGMSNELLIMVLAVVIAVVIMLIAAEGISGFVNRHATVKVLALAFLLMVGVVRETGQLHFAASPVVPLGQCNAQHPGRSDRIRSKGLVEVAHSEQEHGIRML